MFEPAATPARTYFKGIGDAVADRTINRKIEANLVAPETVRVTIPRRDDMALDHEVTEYCKSNGYIIDGYHVVYGDDMIVEIDLNVVARRRTEIWADVAHRVAEGSALLQPGDYSAKQAEFLRMNHHLRQTSLLMSGRHLQHGDAEQPSRNMEVFTNCATSAVSFLTFYLLLNGSGVGRDYSDAMMEVDWSNMPIVVCVIDGSHPDSISGEIVALDRRSAEHLYTGNDIIHYEVPDSPEGWAKAIEQIELLTFQGGHRDDVLMLDFSGVRCKGSPIRGMQNRPASGPGPLMNAIKNIARIRDTKMEPWRQAMYVDHYLAECVLAGGARRAARMSTKSWRDPGVIDFVNVKRPIEFMDKTGEEILAIRAENPFLFGFLWSSNNSVTVDAEFWELVKADKAPRGKLGLWRHAKAVLEAICEASYYDGTGEPGIINQDKLTQNDEGYEDYLDGDFAESERYKLEPATKGLMKALAKASLLTPFRMITNPCGEICLIALGGYCVIADVVPYHAASRLDGPSYHIDPRLSAEEAKAEVERQWDEDAEDAFRTAARALIRTNTMDCLYGREVRRTNRIGVGITGLHEYAWARFGYGFRDIIDEQKSLDFWMMLARFKRAVRDEAVSYATELGVTVPHTDTTIKPAGTTSKLFGLTEGAHLPSMREYLRWVQFRNDDPLVEEYRAKGYPIRKLKTYPGTTIVGFPTRPEICRLGMGEKLVTAAEATPEEQYQYLRLLEKYWIRGVDEEGNPLAEETGNQVSYTLKYKPEETSYEEFKRTLIEGQSSIRCCSVMPQSDAASYEYQPEEPVDKRRYEEITRELQRVESMKEEIAFEHVDCGTGGCPIDFNSGDK